jgi:hypothetical protein
MTLKRATYRNKKSHVLRFCISYDLHLEEIDHGIESSVEELSIHSSLKMFTHWKNYCR